MRLELYGRAYKPIKETSISQFVENYQKEMKEYDEKIRDFLKKDSTSFDEYEEFFKEDVNLEHQQELADNTIKDIDYLTQQIVDLDQRIQDEERGELNRPDGQENELLAKYKRWEAILNDLNEREKKKNESNDIGELNIEGHMESKIKKINN
jgi:hypothetical protein